MKLALGVVEEGHGGKSCQKNQSVKIVRVTTCHPQNSVLSRKKILKVNIKRKNYLPKGKKNLQPS